MAALLAAASLVAQYMEAPRTVATWGMAVVTDIIVNRWVSTADGTVFTAIGLATWTGWTKATT